MSLCRFVCIGKISLLAVIIEQLHGYLLNLPNRVLPDGAKRDTAQLGCMPYITRCDLFFACRFTPGINRNVK